MGDESAREEAGFKRGRSPVVLFDGSDVSNTKIVDEVEARCRTPARLCSQLIVPLGHHDGTPSTAWIPDMVKRRGL